MKTITRHVLLTIGLSWTLLLSAPTQAAFLSAYEGYSVFGEQCELCDSTVSFAVWENTGGDWLNDLPSPTDLIGTSTGAERYVYLYQIVNTNPLGGEEQRLENFNITYGNQGAGVTPSPFRSGGYLDQLQFTDLSREVTPLDVPNDGSPSALTSVKLSTTQAFMTNPDAIAPVALSFDLMSAPAVGGGLFPGALFQWAANNQIEPGEISTVLYLTSNLEPTFRWAETESPGGSSAAGDIPSVVPLPTSVWLFGASLVAVISLARRRSA
jgi:hypothetical protein